MRIAIVEDEMRLAKMMKTGMEQQGFAVDLIHDGDEAVERLLVHHSVYDLVILDLMLPGRGGLDICKVVREHGVTTPILILTARDQTADKVVLLDAGADDYMTKPFAFAELLARGRALMRRPDATYPSELGGQDIQMDVGNHKVFRGAKELVLTVKEFALLEFFLRHPNQVLDRERILDHIWDFNYNSFSNVVDVHIKNLRKKLGQSKLKDEYIETVSGVGYRFQT